MLSYQHSYHAGCLADVHKHSVLCAIFDILKQKDKPLTYFETHAGRGLYDLQSTEALKTGEAAIGIQALNDDKIQAIAPAYYEVLKTIRQTHGPDTYPGSPAIAKTVLRDKDCMAFMELHPQEIQYLKEFAERDKRIQTHHRDGYEGVLALSPPTPGRGLVLIDPSYEVKTEYQEVVRFIHKLTRKWPVGVIVIWYPILPSASHKAMVASLQDMGFKDCLIQDIYFPSLKDKRGMDGSGIIILNTPYGLTEAIANFPELFSNGCHD